MRTAYLLLTALLAGPFTQAVAQVDTVPLPEEETEEAVEPIRRYTVELIVFAYDESVSAGTEIWLPDTSEIGEMQDAIPDRPPVPSDYPDPDDELTEIEVPNIGRRYMDLELVLFGEDDYSMNGIYDQLVELESYEPLVRAGWTQPTYEKELTGPIALQSLAESPPWLDGKLTLYLGRYLHLVVDLTMGADRTVAEEPEDETAVELTFGDSRIQNEYGAINVYGELLRPPIDSIHYRIFEDRIVKNGDIRYFDHPKFGVIAKITRFEEPEEDEFIDDTDDLLPGDQLSP